METAAPQGTRQSLHQQFQFKDVRQLIKAITAYELHATFTAALVESYRDQNWTPSDWMQLCRVVLSEGDYLIWRSDYQENCRRHGKMECHKYL